MFSRLASRGRCDFRDFVPRADLSGDTLCEDCHAAQTTVTSERDWPCERGHPAAGGGLSAFLGGGHWCCVGSQRSGLHLGEVSHAAVNEDSADVAGCSRSAT